MKKFNRIFAGILVFTMLFAQTAFAATNVTRIEFTKELMDGYGITIDKDAESPFTDVTGEDAAYAATAAEANIIAGYEDGTFRPDENVTVEQGIVMALNAKGLAEDVSAYTDDSIMQILGDSAEMVSPWAQKYVAYAVLNGLVEVDGLDGKAPMTDENCALIIANIDAFDPATAAALPEPMPVEVAESVIPTETPMNGDMSAVELLNASSAILNIQETYKMTGEISITEDFKYKGQSLQVTGDSTVESQVEIPDRISMKQTVTIKDETVVNEMFVDGSSLYVKSQETGEWKLAVENEMFAMSTTSKVLSPEQTAFLEDYVVLGEDVTVDGKVYKTVNVSVDSETFKTIMSKQFATYKDQINDLILSTMPAEATQEEKDMALETINQMFANMSVACNATYYINAETMLPEKMDFNIDIVFPLEIKGESIEIIINESGTFDLYDFGAPVEFPVVK